MNPLSRYYKHAYTLIEVIVSLVLVGLLAALLIPIWSGSINRSDVGLTALPSALEIHSAMENIVYAHDRNPDLARLSTLIGPEGSDQDNDFGTYSVVHNRYVYFDDQGVERNGLPDTELLKITVANKNGDKLSRLFSFR